MTQTVLIGSSCTLGKLLSSQRFYDYLIDESNAELLHGKQFGELILICPSLQADPISIKADPAPMIASIHQLMKLLAETKVERLTYITGMDLIPEDGNDQSPLMTESDDPYLDALIQLRDFINVQFGRVLTMRTPELLGLSDGYSVLTELRLAQAEQRAPQVHLLELHQFYPVDHLLKDMDKAWRCGMFSVLLSTPPLTVFDVAELFFPDVIDRLPLAKKTDPVGSNRTLTTSLYWHDPINGYIMDKEEVIEAIVNDLLAACAEEV
ncbi:MAG: hypothetical protein RR250_03670 [Akkermansia sp.]